MKDNAPHIYYAFVDTQKRDLVEGHDGSHAYWLSPESAIDVVKKIHRDAPDFDMTRYAIARITRTYTEYAPGNDLDFMNIDVMYTFTQVL